MDVIVTLVTLTLWPIDAQARLDLYNKPLMLARQIKMAKTPRGLVQMIGSSAQMLEFLHDLCKLKLKTGYCMLDQYTIQIGAGEPTSVQIAMERLTWMVANDPEEHLGDLAFVRMRALLASVN